MSIVLLSGGLDSTTCLYYAKKKEKELVALSFQYGQKHSIELKFAKKTTKKLGVKHIILKIDPTVFQNTSLVDKKIKVPKDKLNVSKIPNTYVPGRNILFLSYAVSLAESLQKKSIYIGVNALDFSGYPDCRPDFIKAFQMAINLGTRTGDSSNYIKIETPLLKLSKSEIISMANRLKVPFHDTHSCYDPINGKPCNHCDSCILRKKGFQEAGLFDN